MRVAHRAPPEHWHIHFRMMNRDVLIPNVVMRVGDAFGCCLVHAVLDYEGRERSVCGYRLSNDHMAPGGGKSIGADSDFDAMEMHRPIITALHVIFSSPDEFDWSSAQAFRDRGCFALYV